MERSAARANVFDDARSAPSWAAVILALLFIVFGGIALYCSTPESATPTFLGAVAAMGVLGAYYVFQLCSYATVGYAFPHRQGRSMWLSGFAASQAFTGIALAVPALLLMYVPEWKIPLLYACAAIYCAGRLVFIGKGIRIFTIKSRSLLYFYFVPLHLRNYTLVCRICDFGIYRKRIGMIDVI